MYAKHLPLIAQYPAAVVHGVARIRYSRLTLFLFWIFSVSCADVALSAEQPATSAERLALAAGNGDVAALQELLGQVNPNVRDSRGETALVQAVRNGRMEPVRQLLAAGAQANQQTAQGMTLLGLAVLNGDEDIARALLAAGARPDERSADGNTALHYAVSLGRLRLAERLLADGADANAQGAGGARALALAQKAGANEVAKLLLAHGATSSAD